MRYSRRQFVQSSAALLAVAGLASAMPGSLIAQKRRVAPSDRILIGLVGCNGMGYTDLDVLTNVPEVEAIALCDVDRNVLERRAADLEKKTGKKATLYADWRALIDNQDVDAVIVGTPEHWHPLIMLSAGEAGKDVYCETPMANSIEEIERMRAAAHKYNRVVQIGQWQRSGPHWKEAMEFVWSGALGDIRTVKTWAYQGWMENIPVRPDEPVPEGVDYDMWLGPAPKRPFNPIRFHFNFRWFWDYAGGLMTDWGVHIIDMALWGMKAESPTEVVAMGGKLGNPDGAEETPDTLTAIYQFDGWTMLWEHAQGISNGPYGRDHGVAFVGNNGTLVADRGGWEVIPEYSGQTPRMEAVARREGGRFDLQYHANNFIECMKTRATPNCDVDTGRLAALNAHLGNIAYRTGRKVKWNGATGTFENDEEANELTKSHYRAPWTLPTV